MKVVKGVVGITTGFMKGKSTAKKTAYRGQLKERKGEKGKGKEREKKRKRKGKRKENFLRLRRLCG
ncbi:hypothetical protein LQZ19_15175 [Treponema primitia]|uniref:hypothetical protein n=1 Tax=Treponema primitia TaxID=88058 RepID=UPI00397FA2B2